MKKILTPIAFAIALAGCQTTDNNELVTTKSEVVIQVNPFFEKYDTPFGIAPFDKIKNEHYLPAFAKGIAQSKEQTLEIANSPLKPTFENTIEAMEKSGVLLNKVSNVFYGLTGSMSSDEVRTIAKELSPQLSALSDDILLNEKLFKRVKSVYDNKDSLKLRVDQKTLLEDTYKNFVRGGANLTEDNKKQLRDLNQKISKLSLKFGENLLAETNNFEVIIDKESDLAGLPDDIIAAAAQTAKERGHKDKWVFTTHRPSKNPFLTYAQNRDLRKAVYNGYTHRGDNDNEFDNKKLASKIASLRFQRAQVLGYKTHADYVLENATAKTPQNVYKLLD